MHPRLFRHARAFHGQSMLASVALLGALGFSLLASPVQPPWRTDPPDRERGSVTVGGVELDVELAVTPREQQRGLGYRDALAPGTGMLFVYEEPETKGFWMKGMRFCLDIIWINEGRIVGAEEAICPAKAGAPEEDIPRTKSPGPVQYVLEVPAGWLEENGLGSGAPVTVDLDGGAAAD